MEECQKNGRNFLNEKKKKSILLAITGTSWSFAPASVDKHLMVMDDPLASGIPERRFTDYSNKDKYANITEAIIQRFF